MKAVRNFSALAFFMRHEALYLELWEILGRTWTDLAAEAVWGVQNVPGSDHGKLKIELTEEQRRALLRVLAAMAFFRAMTIRPGAYDELEVTGGKFPSMVNVAIANKKLIEQRKGGQPVYKFGRILCQHGQRPGTDWQDGTVEQIVAGLSESVLQHSWVRREMKMLGTGLFEGPFATEFELGILAWIIAYDGNVRVGEYVRSTDTVSLPGIPLREIESCTLVLPDNTPVLVINCPAVERSHGDPRPTTASSTAYRHRHYPLPEGSTLVVRSRPTHGYRVCGAYEKQVQEHSPSVTIYGLCGPAPKPLKVLPNALGEAVWLLAKAHEEWRTLA